MMSGVFVSRLSGIGCCVVAALLPVAMAAGSGETDVSPWPPAQRQVFRGVRTGQVEMDLDVFDARGRPMTYIEQVRRAWMHRPSPILIEQRDGWLQVVQADGDWVETVRVREAPVGPSPLERVSATQALVGEHIRVRPVSTADRLEEMTQPAFPDILPRSARIVQRVGNREGRTRVDTIVARATVDAATAVAQLRDRAGRHGFSDAVPMPATHGIGAPEGPATVSAHGNSRGAAPAAASTGIPGVPEVRPMAGVLIRGDQSLAFTVTANGTASDVVVHWSR